MSPESRGKGRLAMRNLHFQAMKGPGARSGVPLLNQSTDNNFKAHKRGYSATANGRMRATSSDIAHEMTSRLINLIYDRIWSFLAARIFTIIIAMYLAEPWSFLAACIFTIILTIYLAWRPGLATQHHLKRRLLSGNE